MSNNLWLICLILGIKDLYTLTYTVHTHFTVLGHPFNLRSLRKRIKVFLSLNMWMLISLSIMIETTWLDFSVYCKYFYYKITIKKRIIFYVYFVSYTVLKLIFYILRYCVNWYLHLETINYIISRYRH